MTIEKYKHYLGNEIVNFILSQNLNKLEEMKKQLIFEINNINFSSNILFKYTLELELIKQTIKNNK